MVSLIAAMGLRIWELLALRWSVLDLEGGALAVRESVFEGRFQPLQNAEGGEDDSARPSRGCGTQVTPRTHDPDRISQSGVREPQRRAVT
jgi:integrase